jgi:hypothetical protein
MTEPRSAAAAFYPHLKSASEPERSPANNKQNLAAVMYPNQTAEAKAQAAWRAREKQRLLRHLREANAAADARMARERGR